MSATFDFDQLLTSVLAADGPQAVPSASIDAALAQARQVGQRRPIVRAIDRRAWPAPRLSPANPAAARFATVGLVLLLTIALIAAGIFVGGRLLHRPASLPGTWTPTGPAAPQRSNGASAMLKDGRVLFVGGVGEDGNLAPSELFDPATNAFDRTHGEISSPRYSLTATTMADGRVLVAGGKWDDPGGSTTSVATAELFDPVTRTFTPTGPMMAPRSSHTATLLADGRRVLVVGGFTNDPGGGQPILNAAEIYDPAAGSWSAAGTTFLGRYDHTATLLPDGRVLVAGGSTDAAVAQTAEVFDPVTRTFSDTPPMTTPRSGHGATALPDGRVLIVGGTTQTPTRERIVESAELYDPTTGRFSETGSMATERSNPTVALLRDGRVMVAGGGNQYGSPRSAELYDPAAGTFQLAASASADLIGPAFRLPDGRILVAGSKPEVFDPTATTRIAEIPPRSDGTFAATGDAMGHRAGHTATRLRDGRVLIVGGDEPVDGTLASAEIYDPKTGASTATGSLGTPRSGHAALLLADGRVLIAGGDRYEQLEVYDPEAGRFSDAGSLAPTSGFRFGGVAVALVRLDDGRIIAFGPVGAGTTAYEVDPVHGRSTQIKDVFGCGGLHSAVALADTRVVLLCEAGKERQSAYLFDVGTGQSNLLAVPLVDGPVSMVRLADDRVLFANGVASTSLSVYDPATNRVAVGGVLPALPGDPGSQRGAGPALTLLADGRVLIVGGSGAALWDPATGAPTTVPAPIAARDGQTGTLLADGRVLLVGGTRWPADRGAPRPPEAELFDPAALR